MLHEIARFYRDPRSARIVEAIANGTVAIGFDARTKYGGLHNHGTKFSINIEDFNFFMVIARNLRSTLSERVATTGIFNCLATVSPINNSGNLSNI